MRRICCILLLLAAAPLSSQSIFNDPYGYFISNHYGYGATAGAFQVNFSNLNNRLHAIGFEKSFNPFYSTVGVQSLLPSGTRRSEYDGVFLGEIFLPQHVQNDSQHVSFGGFHILNSFFGKDLLHSETFDLIVAPGIDWGMGLYSEPRDGQKKTYHNVFISPLARAEFHYSYKKFITGVRIIYRYDLTNPDWSKDQHDPMSVAETHFSGAGAQFFVGINLYPKPVSQFAPPSENGQ